MKLREKEKKKKTKITWKHSICICIINVCLSGYGSLILIMDSNLLCSPPQCILWKLSSTQIYFFFLSSNKNFFSATHWSLPVYISSMEFHNLCSAQHSMIKQHIITSSICFETKNIFFLFSRCYFNVNVCICIVHRRCIASRRKKNSNSTVEG